MLDVVFMELWHPVSDDCYERGFDSEFASAGKKLELTSRKSSESFKGFHGIEFLNDLHISTAFLKFPGA